MRASLYYMYQRAISKTSLEQILKDAVFVNIKKSCLFVAPKIHLIKCKFATPLSNFSLLRAGGMRKLSHQRIPLCAIKERKHKTQCSNSTFLFISLLLSRVAAHFSFSSLQTQRKYFPSVLMAH